MNVVILAAGQGKRMRSDVPKVLHRLAGKSLLGYVIDTARMLGAGRPIVVHGHGGEAVQAAFRAEAITWVRQEPQLGTGHAVMQASPHLDDTHPTLVLYGDVPLTRIDTLRRLTAASTKGLALLTVELENPSGYGRIVRRDGSIHHIVEHKDASVDELAIHEVNTGILIAPTARLKQWLGELSNNNVQAEYYLTDVIAMAVTEGTPVNAVQPSAAWETLGVNSKGDLAALERVAQRNIAAALLEQGVTLADPARIDVRGELICGRDVSIDANCVFEGRVKLGDRVWIGPNCVLRDLQVGADTRIEAFCHLDQAEIGPACRIGPYARLRPGTMLASDVHIGNFVEVKAATIGDHSKANHLSYVGDATVGKKVNIGAGTITCNYDGANKHRTIIEDEAFIGSDTQLVAPVKVGRGATLGAGTTLTRDAPADRLTVSRAKQITLDGWQRPTKKTTR